MTEFALDYLVGKTSVYDFTALYRNKNDNTPMNTGISQNNKRKNLQMITIYAIKYHLFSRKYMTKI
jgi:hypothetical protein